MGTLSVQSRVGKVTILWREAKGETPVVNTAVVSGAIHDLSCLAPLSVRRLYEIARGVSAALARPRTAPSNQPLTDILDFQALQHNA